MPRLISLSVEGTPFEAGHQMGRFGAARLQAYARQSPAWASVMRLRGTPLALALAGHWRQALPRAWQELEGLAAGLEMPFEDVLLWNCRGDLWAMAPDGCTTVQQAGPMPRITHNEDGDPFFAGHCAIATFDVQGAHAFASFLYPGSLPGHTFAVTDAGLAMTVNNLRCRDVRPGVPRMALTRALLDVSTLDAALALLRGTPRAGGFHLTLAHRASPRLVSVEFSSEACSVQDISGYALHANHAVHAVLQHLPQVVTPSSLHRQQRGDALLQADWSHRPGEADALRILADTDNADLPIYRTAPDDSDGENTLATADIRIGPAAITWHVYESAGAAPRFPMIDGHAAPEKSPASASAD